MNQKQGFNLDDLSISCLSAQRRDSSNFEQPLKSSRSQNESFKAIHDLYIQNCKKVKPISNPDPEDDIDENQTTEVEEAYHYQRPDMQGFGSPCNFGSPINVLSSGEFMTKFFRRGNPVNDQTAIFVEENDANKLLVKDVRQSEYLKKSTTSQVLSKTILNSSSDLPPMQQSDSYPQREIENEVFILHENTKLLGELNLIMSNSTSSKVQYETKSEESIEMINPNKPGIMTELDDIIDKVEKQIIKSKNLSTLKHDDINYAPKKIQKQNTPNFSQSIGERYLQKSYPKPDFREADLKSMNYAEITSLIENIKKGITNA